MNTYTIDLNSIGKVTDDNFYLLCRRNPELKLELNAQGGLIIMSPTGGETGNRNAELIVEFGIWNRQAKLGKIFDSSTYFKLPNGAKFSPDVAWIKLARWQQLSPQSRVKFPPIAPDFVLELMSPSDSLVATQAKLNEYIENGVKLGWLINPQTRQVEVYRLGKAKEVLDNPQSLSGEDVLPGFILDLQIVWG